MKKSELTWYEFFQSHKCEYHWYDDMCIVFMSFYDIEEFIEEIGDPCNDFSEDGGINCKWQGSCLAIDFMPICEYYGIETEMVFNREEEL